MLYFLYYTKSRKKAAEPPKNATKGGGKSTRSVLSRQGHCREAAKDLILLVGSCCLGGLIQGLQNLELPERETDWYFLRRAKSTAKTRRGLRPSGLPGTIQSSAEEYFSKFFRRHVSNPAFRKKRRRKGFESVRCSGVTA